MVRFVSLASVIVVVASATSYAQTTYAQTTKPPSQAQVAQQQRMVSCNAAAGQRSLSGDARKSYMSACLGGKMDQTMLMKVCNSQATQDKLSADDRRQYLGTCLKKTT